MDIEMRAENESGKESRAKIDNDQIEARKDEIRKPPLVLFWQLIPFIRRTFLYFAILALYRSRVIDLNIVLLAILKCAPIMTLTIFIFRQFNSLKRMFQNVFATLVFVAHAFTIVGAMVIVFDQGINEVFIIGKSFHIVGIILYTVACGIKPFAFRLFIRSFLAAALGYYYLYVSGLNRFGVEHKILGGVSIAAVFTLQWRGWARITLQDLLHGRWYEFLGGMGSSSFVIAEVISLLNAYTRPAGASYSLLAADYTFDVFVYMGSFLLALSVLDGKNVTWPQEVAIEKKRSEAFKKSLGKASTCLSTSIIRLADWTFS